VFRNQDLSVIRKKGIEKNTIGYTIKSLHLFVLPKKIYYSVLFKMSADLFLGVMEISTWHIIISLMALKKEAS